MASSLRLPVGSMTSCMRPGITSTQPLAYSIQSRSFSEASHRWAAIRSNNFKPKNPAMPSMKNRQRDALLTSNKPTDIGLLPGTFVRPLYQDLPWFYTRERWHMEWVSLKSWFQNYVSLWQYCREDDDLKWGLKERRQRAKLLYQDMYTAFARGDVSGIKRLCGEGLARDLISQIERRPEGQVVTWNLAKWLRKPSTNLQGLKVMSDRATALPNLTKSGIRQIVLRATSRQSMVKSQPTKTAATEAVEAQPKQQDVLEYVVIQELRWNGEGSWRVWGFTKATDSHTTMTDPSFAPGLSTVDRLNLMRGGQ